MIDLHLHTTASDGRSSPIALVEEAAAAGVRTLAVTDHDTMAAWPEVRAAAEARGLTAVPGIEITAIHGGRDLHLLGYFLDPEVDELAQFLTAQREHRRRRVHAIAARLAQLGVPLDVGSLLAVDARSGRSLGRPLLAAGMVAAGHVATMREAFDRFLAEGQPAFIERIGPPPADVIAIVQRAGGLTSLAHPGKFKHDSIIPGLVDAGLAALEAHHPDHDEIDTARYRHMAHPLNLLITGGSDYHGPGSGRTEGLGQTHLPADDYERLRERAAWPRAGA